MQPTVQDPAGSASFIGKTQRRRRAAAVFSKSAQCRAVFGIIDAETNLLVETIPQSSASNSVAADYRHNRIFVPQVAPVAIAGPDGDTTEIGAGICGTGNGCVAVYVHDVDGDDADTERDR
ncbi:MAG: hypothetical protein JO081_00025 [Alphaproteobacteria bacterium]|nr:hypothetical protein [Alphaproteobacteria bacterium]